MKSISRRSFLRYGALAGAAFDGCSRTGFARTQVNETERASSGPLEGIDVRRLAAQVAGEVVTPDAAAYESSRLVFNRAFDRYPALIVRCANAADVARVLEFSQRHTLPLAVRGGGHSRAGLSSCDAGIILDLSFMNRVELDKERRAVRAGAGALTVHVDAATQEFGLATTLAGCPAVGIAGLTLGGGEGLLMSKYGAACDNLLSAHIVTASGNQLVASESSHPDLFWAIRGGGGNFGVATQLQFRVYPLTNVLAGKLAYPPGRIPELLGELAKFTATCPDECNVIAQILPMREGAVFRVLVCHCGDPQRGNALLQPLRELGPNEDEFRIISYLQANATINPASPVAHFQTNLFLAELSETSIATIADATAHAPKNTRVFIVPFYGAVTRVPVVGTAFPLRSTGFELDLMGRWESAAEKDGAVQWVKTLRDQLRSSASGAYVNQLGETSNELVRFAYGQNYSRLAALKRKYDPSNVLRSNQNVPPENTAALDGAAAPLGRYART